MGATSSESLCGLLATQSMVSSQQAVSLQTGELWHQRLGQEGTRATSQTESK